MDRLIGRATGLAMVLARELADVRGREGPCARTRQIENDIDTLVGIWRDGRIVWPNAVRDAAAVRS